MGSFARRSSIPKTLRGKTAVNLRNLFAELKRRNVSHQFECAGAATLAHITNWLTNGTQPPTNDEVSSVLCRWFMQPALRLRRETYAELVSTGNLSLLHDVPLRGLLEQGETRHEEALRLDRFLDTLQRITEPLNRYRQWQIDPNSRLEVSCHFDLNGMRSDPAIPSILAQLYRDHTLNRSFREQELAAVRAVHDRIIKLRSER